MAASASDYFQKVGRATATTLSAPGYTVGDTSITVGSTTNWPTSTGVTFAIDTVDSAGVRIDGTYNVFRGTVATGTSITNVTYVGGDTNRNYAAGATTRVYILISSYRDNRMVDGLVVEHNQDGTHSDITATTVATTGVISTGSNIKVADTKSIVDGNSNELIKFSQTASAVNELTVKNAATGNAVQIQATGGDTNIGVTLVPKGTGKPSGFANFYAGTFTISGTGNKAVTGVGFTPKLVVFDWVAGSSATADNNTSGWMTSTAQFAKWSSSNSGANTSARNAYTDSCFANGSSASSTASERASYVSMDSDGFTVNVSTSASGTWAFIAYA